MINHHNYLLPYLIYRSAIYFYAYQGACRRQSMEPQRSSASERHSLGRKASSIVAQLNDATTPIDLALTNDQTRRSTLRPGGYAESSLASSTARAHPTGRLALAAHSADKGTANGHRNRMQIRKRALRERRIQKS